MDEAARARDLLDRYDHRGVFTPRQTQILRLLAAGQSYDEIAAELGIKPRSAMGQVQKAGLNARVFDARQKQRAQT